MANENSQDSGEIPIISSNNILGNIVERKFNERSKFDSNRLSTVEYERGFPKVFKLDDIQLTKKVCYTCKMFCFCCFSINYIILFVEYQ